MAEGGTRKGLGVAAKAGVSIGLLALIAGQIDGAALAGRLAALPAALWGTGVAVLLALTALQGVRWWATLGVLGVSTPWPWTVRHSLTALMVNQALPGTVGGDAYRILGGVRNGIGWRMAVSGVIADRACGLLGLVAVALCGLAAFAGLDGDGVLTAGLVAVEGGLLAGIGLFLLAHRSPSRWVPGPLKGVLQMSADAWAVARRPGPAGGLLAASVANHLIFLWVLHLFARAMGMGLDVWVFFVVAAPVLLVAQIPVSIAGWGVREGAAAAAFALAGVPAEQAVSLAVATGLVQLLSGLAAGGLATIWKAASGPWSRRIPRRSRRP
jgi:uncharacterized membrane protein YbhN (UPF0104 family)